MTPPSFIHQKLIQQLGRIIGNHIFTKKARRFKLRPAGPVVKYLKK